MTDRHMSDVMHNVRPVTLHGHDTVKAACALMGEHKIGAVLITDADGMLEGIFTGRDAVRLLAEGRSPAQMRLDEVMTRNPTTVAPGRTAFEALHTMHEGGFRHLPVTVDGTLLGIVSHGDFRAIEHAIFDEQTGLWERL